MDKPLRQHLVANLGRATMIAAVVGTVLVMINHGDHIATEPVCPHFWLKAGLCYTVPFVVSMTSVWLARRARSRRRG